MRDILVTVLGLSPAVITETLWALSQGHRERGRFQAEEVHILTTGPGVAATLKDLDGHDGAIARLVRDWKLPTRPRLEVHAIHDRNGAPVEDIRTLEQSIALADSTVRLIGDLTESANTRIHASMAGGRKTMSFYMGYVMSLFGRPQDELSHVLVNPAKYEQKGSGFWYPTPATPDARIYLYEIPFVRLRDHLDAATFARLRSGTFEDVVAAVQTALARPHLVLHDHGQRAEAAERSIRLDKREYALYRLLAEIARDERIGAGPEGIGPEHKGWLTTADLDHPADPMMRRFHAIYAETFSTYGERARAAERAAGGPGRPIDISEMAEIKKEFAQLRSKINTAVKAALGSPMLYKDFVVHFERGRSGNRRQPSRFGLALEPSRIEIFED